MFDRQNPPSHFEVLDQCMLRSSGFISSRLSQLADSGGALAIPPAAWLEFCRARDFETTAIRSLRSLVKQSGAIVMTAEYNRAWAAELTSGERVASLIDWGNTKILRAHLDAIQNEDQHYISEMVDDSRRVLAEQSYRMDGAGFKGRSLRAIGQIQGLLTTDYIRELRRAASAKDRGDKIPPIIVRHLVEPDVLGACMDNFESIRPDPNIRRQIVENGTSAYRYLALRLSQDILRMALQGTAARTARRFTNDHLDLDYALAASFGTALHTEDSALAILYRILALLVEEVDGRRTKGIYPRRAG